MFKKEYYKNKQRVYLLENDYLIFYFIDGKVKAEGPFIDDMMQGLWKFYKKEGFLWQTTEFKNNMKHGKNDIYDKDGNIIDTKVFIENKKQA